MTIFTACSRNNEWEEKNFHYTNTLQSYITYKSLFIIIIIIIIVEQSATELTDFEIRCKQHSRCSYCRGSNSRRTSHYQIAPMFSCALVVVARGAADAVPNGYQKITHMFHSIRYLLHHRRQHTRSSGISLLLTQKVHFCANQRSTKGSHFVISWLQPGCALLAAWLKSSRMIIISWPCFQCWWHAPKARRLSIWLGQQQQKQQQQSIYPHEIARC